MQVMIKQMHKVWMKSEAGKERSEEQISISGVGRARCSSQDEGNDGFPGARVVLEPLLVVSAESTVSFQRRELLMFGFNSQKHKVKPLNGNCAAFLSALCETC